MSSAKHSLKIPIRNYTLSLTLLKFRLPPASLPFAPPWQEPTGYLPRDFAYNKKFFVGLI